LAPAIVELRKCTPAQTRLSPVFRAVPEVVGSSEVGEPEGIELQAARLRNPLRARDFCRYASMAERITNGRRVHVSDCGSSNIDPGCGDIVETEQRRRFGVAPSGLPPGGRMVSPAVRRTRHVRIDTHPSSRDRPRPLGGDERGLGSSRAPPDVAHGPHLLNRELPRRWSTPDPDLPR
jgi:hypothetical protein